MRVSLALQALVYAYLCSCHPLLTAAGLRSLQTLKCLQQSSAGFLPGAIGSLGSKLFDPLQQQAGGSNGIFLSPYGISQALALLANGVAPGSQSDQQLKSVVFGMDKAQPTYELNFAFAGLNSQLTQATLGLSRDISINNSVWLPADYKPDPNYERAVARFYDAEVKNPAGAGRSQGGPAAATLTIHVSQSGNARLDVALQSGPEAAKVCSSQPGGSPAAGQQPCLLLDIQYDTGALGAGKLTVVTASVTASLTQNDYSRAALLLASALIFNGLWDTAFIKGNTKPQLFHLPNGDTLNVAMMNRFTMSPKLKVAQYTASSTPCIGVQVPYKGDDFSALVVMAQGSVTAGGGSGGSGGGNSSSGGGGAGAGQQAGCACSATGMSGGVQTNRIGCAQHLLSQGDAGYFCMVVNPSDCAVAQPIASFPGAAWVACTPGQPDGTNKDVGSSGGPSQGLVFAPTGAAYSTALAACRSQLLTGLAGSGITWQSQEDRGVNVSLPRFQLEFMGALKSALGQLGLTQPFQGGDITQIATAPNGQALTGLFVRDVFHRTAAKVNEEGTQATSATTVIQASPPPRPPGARATAPGQGPPPVPVSVVVDRPFAVVIQHNPSATALFVGQVDRPEQM